MLKRDLSYFIWGCLWLLTGLALIVFQQSFVNSVVAIAGVVICLLGLTKFPEAIFSRKRYPKLSHKLLHCADGLIHLVIGVLIIAWSQVSPLWLARLVGIYQLMLGAIAFVNYLLLRKDRVPRHFNQLVIALVNLIFGLFSLFDKGETVDTLIRLGLYLIFVGLTMINDGRRMLITEEKERSLKRRIRISVPVVFTMFLPHSMLTKINSFINNELDLSPEIEASHEIEAAKVTKGKPVLKVFIHTSESGFNAVGHCDLSYKGQVYAFGNYDVDSERFFGTVGDGVFVETAEAPYIDYCVAYGKTLFEYQLVLNQEQQAAFEAKLGDLRAMMVPWQPESDSQKQSYMGQLQAQHGAVFHKFTRSRFKTYFVLGTNCVLLADQLIGTAGLDLISMAGILAPGTYYDYFETEYANPNSIVTGRRVHHPGLPALTGAY